MTAEAPKLELSKLREGDDQFIFRNVFSHELHQEGESGVGGKIFSAKAGTTLLLFSHLTAARAQM